MPGSVIRPVLSTIQIQKLGHKLEEIRLRALNSIVSKLEHGFVSEKDLAAQKDLVVKLLDWFSFETCPEAEKVLNLILLLLKADADGTLYMQVEAKGGHRALDAVRTKVDPKLLCLIDEIVNEVNKCKPHSDPTDTQDSSLPSTSGEQPNLTHVGMTVTLPDIEAKDQEDLQSSPVEVAQQSSHGYFTNGSAVPAARIVVQSQQPRCFKCLILPWQPLVATDHHVLLAVEESLASTTDLPLVLHTCQFFTDVILRDFPAEVFLQRPPILKMFLELLDSDRRVCEAVACCLCKLTAALRVRVCYYSDPGIANLKQAICSRPNSDPSSPSYVSGNSSSTLSIGRPIVGQYLNSDTAQNNHGSTGFQAYQQNVSKEASCSSEATEDSVLLQLQQLSLPRYCLLCLFHTVPHLGPSSGVRCENPALLAAELVRLFAMCVKQSIWSSADPVAQEVSQHLQQVLILVGEVLEKYRSVGVKEEANRLMYLQLLALVRKLLVTAVPVSLADSILHTKLKNALSRSLIDLSVIALFPEVHADILQYVKVFQTSSDADCFLKYETAMTICASMKAAVRFLKNHDKLERETFEVLDKSLPSLSFHGNLDIVRNCIEIAVNKLYHMSLDDGGQKVVTGVILKLIAHADPRVKLEMYRCCHKYVVAILGVQQVSRLSVGSSRPLDFLCDTAVLIEIISHGAASMDKKIQQYSEEILIHLLKSKFILTEPAWQQFLECLIPALPLLQCYADQTTSLGRAIVKIFDPETSQSIHLPRAEVLKGNLRLLFCSDPLTREEAISRITWLMAREERSYEKLPNFSSLRGLLLNSVCLMDRPVDLGQRRTQQHFYQIGSLCQVVELLRSRGIEPVVRRSAVTQITVMLEDSNLHDQFLKQDGLNLILDILHKALVDKEYNSYPDLVIPCISTLKNVVLYSPKLRQELSRNIGLFSCIVRAMYLYSGDDRLRPDSSVLLCLLLNSDFILSVPEPADVSSPWHCFSLPDLMVRHMRLPFLCHSHWHSSPHTQLSEKRDLLKNEDCFALLRLCWNVEWFGGLEVILSWSEVPPTFDTVKGGKLSGFSDELRLLEGDLSCLKATAVTHRCKQHLYDIQNATTHQAVLKSLTCITGYLALRILVNGKVNSQIMKSTSNLFDASHLQSFDWWHDLPWAETFKRFLGIPPACPEDQQLLVSVLKLLRLYLNTCWRSEQAGAGEQKFHPCWVTHLLKDSAQPLPNLLLRLADTSGGTDVDDVVLKELCREILQLVQECSLRERKLEEIGKVVLKKSGEDNTSNTAGPWIHIIRAVTRNLTFSDTQHFYNLAFLDWMLSCLAHLTSIPGWSDHTDGNVHQLWNEQISCLVELVTAFHCGKGGDSLASFMGLSITRSAVLCMNHLLCEMQHSTNSKGWETMWLCCLGAETHAAGHANLIWLPPLWLSRDPVVRSAALQLVAGFCSSRRGCGRFLSGLSTVAGGVWGAGLSFLLDHEEACLVREQAAALLVNVSSYSISASGGGTSLSQCHTAVKSEEAPLTGIQALQSLLSQCNFYGDIAKLLSRLYMGSTVDPSGVNGASDWTVESLCDGQVPPDAELQPHQWALLYDSSCKSNSFIEYEGSSARTESSQLEPYVKTTPGLVKTVCWLMANMIALNPDDSLRHINGFGLIRLLLGCLVTGVPQEYRCRSNVLLYVDILEMYTGICCVLSRCVSLDEACHSTILHTRDSVQCLLALLDPDVYSTHSAQLVFLRNRLWSELFQLFSALLSGKQGFETIRDALFHCGPWRYFATLMMAIENELSNNLHHSALTCLTSLLSHEIRTRSLSEESHVVQNLLDSYFPVPEEDDCYTTQYKLLKQLVLPLQHTSSDHSATECHNRPLMYSKHSNRNNRHVSESSECMLPASNQKNVCPQSEAAANKNKSEASRRKAYQKTNSVDHASSSDEHKEKLSSDTNVLPSIQTESERAVAKNQTVGAELCNLLLRQYEIHKLMQGSAGQRSRTKGRMLVTCALSGLLAVSGEAKKVALNRGLLETLIIQLRELHVKLSLESAESLRRISDKKRVCPVLRNVAVLLAVLTNFLNGDSNVKVAAAEIGLADLVHKLWVWCCALTSLLEAALKMLSTFTTSCLAATQSLVMTTTVLGIGLRKTPSSLSLLHEIVSLIHREMEAVNRAHEAGILSLSFQVLTNSCQSQECRNVIAKSNLFQCLAKLHPSITKKQKHWEAVELMWLQFLSDFTFYPEGQQTLPKITDAMDLLILLTRSSKMENRLAALCVLRNVSFHQLNRPRLLGSGEFLQVLHQKLADGALVEKTIAASMVWALIANNQKGKVVIKCSGIDAKLQEALNQLHLLSTSEDTETDEGIRIISSVLQIIYAENSTTRKQ